MFISFTEAKMNSNKKTGGIYCDYSFLLSITRSQKILRAIADLKTFF